MLYVKDQGEQTSKNSCIVQYLIRAHLFSKEEQVLQDVIKCTPLILDQRKFWRGCFTLQALHMNESDHRIGPEIGIEKGWSQTASIRKLKA